MRPTPDERLEQTLDAWGRAAGHNAAEGAMPASLVRAVASRRHTRRAQQAAGVVALLACVIAVGSWLAPGAPLLDPAPDDRPMSAAVPSPRLIDIQRANPALDLDNLRLPETSFGGAREAVGLRAYESHPPAPPEERLSPPSN